MLIERRTRTSLWLVVRSSANELRAGGLALSKTEDPLNANEQETLAISILLKLEPYSDRVGKSEKAYECESVTADRRGLANRTTLDDDKINFTIFILINANRGKFT